jgi:hypothetical protein
MRRLRRMSKQSLREPPRMETYSVDIDPEQVVRWVMEEHQATPAALRLLARRSTEARDIPAKTEFRLGDEERDDLNEIATLATLEIAPVHAGDGWRLTVLIEDELGPRVADDRLTVEPEEEMEVETFYREFIRTGRGSATVVAEADNPIAKARVTRLLNAIERNEHKNSRGGPRSKQTHT